jgi:hypothetical protein
VKNKQALEQAWAPKDFSRMIFIAGALSSFSQLVFRVLIFTINNNEEVYSEYEFSSVSIIVMALMLGLQQYSQRSLRVGEAVSFKPAPTNAPRAINLDEPFDFTP